jgi:hypothetical protein
VVIPLADRAAAVPRVVPAVVIPQADQPVAIPRAARTAVILQLAQPTVIPRVTRVALILQLARRAVTPVATPALALLQPQAVIPSPVRNLVQEVCTKFLSQFPTLAFSAAVAPPDAVIGRETTTDGYISGAYFLGSCGFSCLPLLPRLFDRIAYRTNARENLARRGSERSRQLLS